jgi:hypothetical protein
MKFRWRILQEMYLTKPLTYCAFINQKRLLVSPPLSLFEAITNEAEMKLRRVLVKSSAILVTMYCKMSFISNAEPVKNRKFCRYEERRVYSAIPVGKMITRVRAGYYLLFIGNFGFIMKSGVGARITLLKNNRAR